MPKAFTATTLAAITLSAIALQAGSASAAHRLLLGPMKQVPIVGQQAGNGQSSVSKGTSYPVGGILGGDSNIGHLPHDPIPPAPGQGGSTGGGHPHGPGLGVSLSVYGPFDPNHFCRIIIHKHKPVRVCSLVPTDQGPSMSFGLGF